MSISRRAALALPALLSARGAPAQAQTSSPWPTRTVRIIVPFTPGGAADIAARLLSEALTPKWGQPVVVENRAGANGIIGTDVVAKAPPDGHTLACTSIVHAVNAPLYRTPYDVLRDVPAITVLYQVPIVLVVAPDFPANSVADLVRIAKDTPARATCVGTGGLYCAMFNMLTGAEVEQIPYRGSTAAHPDLMAGRVAFMVDTLPAALGHIQTGKLKALAVPSRERLAALPDVPTMAEAGYPDFIASTWGALLGPAGLPAALAGRIATDAAEALRAPAMRERMAALGAEVVGSPPAEAQGFVRGEVERWTRVAQSARIERQ
ncbi:tripartite tricarboxylate transporter substrate-binding protein [Muricoccus radiodurans]|uniref:tripartite tricarboxylate transporter substrate-binding protein n=1 Tax=Muricoccus radiodurans TaxID=2231721 RepID=UPI003CF92686